MSIKLPVWMDGDNAKRLRNTAVAWWEQCADYLRLPLTTFDVLSCDLAFVDLLAYQRGIDRFAAESEAFYRLRVHHALRNARAAGTPAGMRQIFDNLQLPQPQMAERLPNRDWDMIRLTYSGRDYARLHNEIDYILRFYWRTCRRFEIYQEITAETQNVAVLVGQHRAANVAQNVPNAVPFRPAKNNLSAGLVGQHRAANVAQNVPLPVPTRRLNFIAQNSADNVLSARAVNVRIFTA